MVSANLKEEQKDSLPLDYFLKGFFALNASAVRVQNGDSRVHHCLLCVCGSSSAQVAPQQSLILQMNRMDVADQIETWKFFLTANKQVLFFKRAFNRGMAQLGVT